MTKQKPKKEINFTVETNTGGGNDYVWWLFLSSTETRTFINQQSEG